MNLLNNIIYKSFNFMGIFNWLSKKSDNAQAIFSDIWRSFCFNLCQTLYTFFARLYQIFMVMTKVEILSEPQIKLIYQRITILLGLIMTFVVIFYLIRLLLSPDRINDKEIGIGNLIKKLVVVILLMGFTPSIFSLAHEFEQTVLDKQLIGKILIAKEMPDPLSTNSNQTSPYVDYGRALSITTFKNFFRKTNQDSAGNCTDYAYNNIEDEFVGYETMVIAASCLNATQNNVPSNTGSGPIDVYTIEYDALISTVVGAILVWIMLVYIINVGTRIIQFTFLQIIAPIPIISYILPSNNKETMFNRWVKQVTTTYIDIFIRVGIIDFVIYLIGIIYDSNLGLSSTTMNLSNSTLGIIRVAITIALLIFARRLPQLLQELSGKQSAASIGFGIGGSNAAAGFLLGASSVAAMNFMGSTGLARFTGLARGVVQGGLAGTAPGNYAQNMDRARQRARQANTTDEWMKMQGYGFPARMWNRAVFAAGGIPRGRRQEYMKFMDENYKAMLKDDDDVKPFTTAKQQQLSFGNKVDQYMEDVGGELGVGDGQLYGIRNFDGSIAYTYDKTSGTSAYYTYNSSGVRTAHAMPTINGRQRSLAEALDYMEKGKMQAAARKYESGGIRESGRAMTRAERFTPGRRRDYIQDALNTLLPFGINYRGIDTTRWSGNMKDNAARATRNPGPSGTQGPPK